MTPEDDQAEQPQTEAPVADSNPSSAGREGLQGDLGVSSERVGPDAVDDDTGIEGIGSRGSARVATDGTLKDTTAEMAAEASDDPAEAPIVGEQDNPAEAASHPLGRKNPGHTHG